MTYDLKTIKLNDHEYVLKSDVRQSAEKLDGMEYCIFRTYSAGVFAGYLKERNGKEATIVNSRNIWYWDGACALSQLAQDGTVAPDNCKFTVVLTTPRILTEVIEILPCTEQARLSIQGVKEWKK